MKNAIKTIREASQPVALNLRQNNIGKEGVEALADALKVMTQPVTLKLWDNNIRDEGAEIFAGALKVITQPITLNLKDTDTSLEMQKKTYCFNRLSKDFSSYRCRYFYVDLSLT